MISVRRFAESDRERWDGYVARTPNSHFAHRTGWKRLGEEGYGWRSHHWSPGGGGGGGRGARPDGAGPRARRGAAVAGLRRQAAQPDSQGTEVRRHGPLGTGGPGGLPPRAARKHARPRNPDPRPRLFSTRAGAAGGRGRRDGPRRRRAR